MERKHFRNIQLDFTSNLRCTYVLKIILSCCLHALLLSAKYLTSFDFFPLLMLGWQNISWKFQFMFLFTVVSYMYTKSLSSI